jgi:hypothetical protein
MKPRNNDIANELQDLVPGAAWTELTPLPGEVPAGYFDQLPVQIMQKIAVQDELEAISPLLATLPKAMPMSVPPAYFEQLTANVLAEVQQPAPAKVIPIRRYVKWAVAACLIGVVSLGSVSYINQKNAQVVPEIAAADNTLADISDQAIVEYLQTHMDAFDKEELLSLASLNTTPAGTVNLPETNELSDEAIQRYLDKTGFLKESPTDY